MIIYPKKKKIVVRNINAQKKKKKNEIGEISRASLLPRSEILLNHKNRFKSCKRQNHRGFKSRIWSETVG